MQKSKLHALQAAAKQAVFFTKDENILHVGHM